MTETLLSKHTKTVDQMKKLLEGIQGSLEGSLGDKKQEQFQYSQFADKWRRTGRDKEYKALLDSLGIRRTLRTALFKDPKKLYLQLNKKRVELEKAMGTKYTRDLKGFTYGKGIFTGIKGKGIIRRELLGTGVNPEYIRGYDQEVIALHDKEAKQAKADYLRSTDQDAPGFDPDGWRLNLSSDNPNRKIRVRDQVYNVQGTQFAETRGIDGPKMRPGTIASQAWVDTDPTGKAVDTPVTPKESLKVGTTYSKDNRYPLTISGKKTSSIQRDLIDSGFSVSELETLIENNKKWQAARGR